MTAPNFKAIREEIGALLGAVTDLQAAYDYRPVQLHGISPVVWVEDLGFRGYLPAARYGQFDAAYAVVVAVNLSSHGAQSGADVFDDARQAVVSKITALDVDYTNFEALQIPEGEFAPTRADLIDGVQYLTQRIPVLALDVTCS